MEDIGVEVSQKIRSAIKAKLVELGAYVDDELPDYIMVMVANKRTKVQMDADLKLFLGGNTTHFTSWLHTVLQKLQEVTIASNLNKLNSLEPTAAEKKLPVNTVLTGSIDEGESHKHAKHKKKMKKSAESSTKKKSVLKKSEKPSKIKVPPHVEQKLENLTAIEPQLNLGFDVKILDQTKSKIHSAKSGVVKLSGESKAKEKLLREANPEVHVSRKQDEALRKPPAETTRKSPDLSVASAAESAAQGPSSVPPMQSDEEDFEDVINIKDSGMMEFFDEEELKEETPKVPRPKMKAPAPQEIEVDDLEEQRANLLRDLELLEKPTRPSVVCDLDLLGKPPRPTAEKYSVTKALARQQGSKVSPSILSRLGSKVDVQPRLKIIDPNEFNIVGPPSDADTTIVKLADRLGRKQPAKSEQERLRNELTKKDSTISNQRKPVSISMKDETTRRNVMDRLGGKTHSHNSDNEDLNSWEKRASANKESRNTQVVPIDKKISKVLHESTQSSKSVKERLGSRPAVQREVRPPPEEAKTKLSDRLGKLQTVGERVLWSTRGRDAEKADQPARREATGDSRVSERGRISDRLGRKEISSVKEERPKLSDRLGKKVRDPEPEEKPAKHSLRVVNVEDDVAGEMIHTSKRALHREGANQEMDELPRKRALLSRVIAVKREPPEDEEPDPNMAVASVIRVQPRPKVPAAMQANRNLLFKAMAEAQKSVATAPVRAVPQEAERKESLFTHKYRDLSSVKINITLSNDVTKAGEVETGERRPPPRIRHPQNINVTLSNSAKEIKREIDAGWPPQSPDVRQMQKINVTLSQRLGESVEKQEDKSKKPSSARRSSPEKSPLSERKNAGSCNASPNNNDGSEHSSDRVDSKHSDNNVGSNHSNNQDNQNSPLEEDEEGLEEIYEEDEEGGVSLNASMGDSEACEEEKHYEADEEYVPTGVSYSAEEPELQRYGATRSVRPGGNTQFVVTLDGLSPEMFNPRKRTADHRERTERPPSPLPVPENERANEESERNVSTVVYKKPRLLPNVEPVKPKERCKYWPTCRQGDQCEFVHPSAPCKSFPSCMFGDKCLYVHPSCKFDTACTRRDCPFTHGAVRLAASALQAKPLARARPLQPVCKFYPKCSNVNCPFLHPKPCRFGRACAKPDCSFFHEEIPSAEKLKWVKTS